ncbi:hypothetical protein V8G54_011179 [Vigna mungo]|uniref:Uncharacterized protein n=1 Tax=Vigna mungo TaxID=3915 RepID=A0AAQ3NS99_VIGMU
MWQLNVTKLKDQRQVIAEEIENSQVLQQQRQQILQNDQQQAPKPQDPQPESESRLQPTIEQQKQSLQQANNNKRKTMEQGLSPETDRTVTKGRPRNHRSSVYQCQCEEETNQCARKMSSGMKWILGFRNLLEEIRLPDELGLGSHNDLGFSGSNWFFAIGEKCGFWKHCTVLESSGRRSRRIPFWWSFSKHCILVIVLEALQCSRAFYQGLEMVFEIRLHHMGRFVNDKGLRYVGGEEHVIVGVDPDRWSYFEALGIIKEQFKYAADFKLWWKGSREIMMNNVRLLSDCRDAMNLAKYAEETEDMVEIYVQHVPSEAEEFFFLLVVKKGHAGEEHIEVQIGDQEVGNAEEEAEIDEEEADHGEEEAEIVEEEADRGEEEAEIGEEEVKEETWRNVVEGEVEASVEEFVDQSEEERMDNDDDGFGVESDRVDDVGRNINPILERQSWGSSFVMDDEVGEHEINEEYNSDELDSDLESDGDGNFKRGKFKKFRQEVKTLVGRHSCGKVFGNKSASVNWIAQVLVDRFVNVASMTVNQIIDDIKKSFSVGIIAWKAGKAKQIALDSLVGDGERQYACLYDYVGELLRVKYGTFKIKVNQPQRSLPPRFGSFYMCLEGCKQGFLGSYRPFKGVDSCHLKTTYGGQLLVAVGRDPNDQYFPLAFAAVENECKETWRWFLSQLFDDIGGTECQRWVFISDQQKGLMTVFDELMDGVEHRLDLMMGAAKATYEKEWEKKMGELKAINIEAYNWLLGIPTRLGVSMPLVPIVDAMEKLMTYPGVVMPRPRKKLDKEIEKSGNWIPTWAGAEKFEDLIGIPCRHVIAAINYKVQNPEDYVHVYYKKPAYVTCYAPEIVPINGQQMWPTSENTPLLLPPIYKTPPGRPKKLRRLETDEPVSHTKLSKKHAIMKYISCKEFGHNVRSCRRKKNTRGSSSAGGSGSRPRSEAEAPPSTSQGAAAGATSTAHGRASRGQAGPSFSGSAVASRGQAAGRTTSRLGADHLGSQASPSPTDHRPASHFAARRWTLKPTTFNSRKIVRLKSDRKRTTFVKVIWDDRTGDVTWEREEVMKEAYPHLFEAAAEQENPESGNQIRWQPGNGRPFVLEAVFKIFYLELRPPLHLRSSTFFRFITPGVKSFHPNRSVFKSEQLDVRSILAIWFEFLEMEYDMLEYELYDKYKLRENVNPRPKFSTLVSVSKVVFDKQLIIGVNRPYSMTVAKGSGSDSILIFRDYATSSRGGRSFSLRVFLYRGGSTGLTSGGGLLSVSQPGPPGCRERRAYRVIPSGQFGTQDESLEEALQVEQPLEVLPESYVGPSGH